MKEIEKSSSVRLHVYLAKNGVCSRRAAERLMAEGRVSVNGKTALEPGFAVVPGRDSVTVDGRQVRPAGPTKHTYVLLNKPRGVVTTAKDEKGRKAVVDLLPSRLGRLFPVGRLDIDSEGWLLMTDDGDLAFRLMHPRYHVTKVYRVKIRGRLTPAQEEKFKKSVSLPEGKTQPAGLRLMHQSGEDAVYEVTLCEGKKRQIRRMMEFLGVDVVRLCRIGEAGISMKGLKPGAWRLLRPDEVHHLKQEVRLT